MVIEKPNQNINKKDLDLILEVNKKAIEIEMEVASQNEEIIELLNNTESSNKKIEEIVSKIVVEELKKITKSNEDLSKEFFKMQVLYITGLLTLIIQVVQIFMKK